MSLAIAIVSGSLCGIIAFVPLFFASRIARPSNYNVKNNLAICLLLVTFSFIFLALALFIVYKLSATSVLAFGLAEAGFFLLATLVFSVIATRYLS